MKKGWWKSRRFQAGVSIVLAVGLLAFFLSQVPLADIGRQIAQASVGWLIASIVVSLLIFVARALRWTWILRPVGRVPFVPAFRATAVGFAANTVLPARAGEVIRPALLAREQGLPFSALLASIVFERILDALAQLLFLGIALSAGAGGVAACSPRTGSAGSSPPSPPSRSPSPSSRWSGGRDRSTCSNGLRASCRAARGRSHCASRTRSWTGSPL